ncbi:MAG: hypothetical protein QCI82_02930 [Candidatus Thermoplasmatota archaeon]|nr:hypothetical protein [Candidatus Thermoplasmatota archaeon]
MMTTIQLDKGTRESLKKFGHKGETYNDIVERLLTYCEEMNLEEMIRDRWMRLQKEKGDYIPLDEI